MKWTDAFGERLEFREISISMQPKIYGDDRTKHRNLLECFLFLVISAESAVLK